MKQTFMVKIKKEEMPEGQIVPMHPEFVFVKSLEENSWTAQNKETEEVVTITKVIKGDFVEYEIKAS